MRENAIEYMRLWCREKSNNGEVHIQQKYIKIQHIWKCNLMLCLEYMYKFYNSTIQNIRQ